MDISQLPQTEVLGVTASDAIAAMLLDQVLEPGRLFTHIEIIYGARRSGRLLYQYGWLGSVPLPTPLTGITAMVEFQKMMREARYDPAENPGSRKGWSIGRAMIKSRAAAVVWCEWAK